MKLHAIVAAHARRAPDREAVVIGSECVTYAELDARADRVAAGLRRAGLAAGDRVVLYLGNGLPFVELFLAVLKAGALAVPVTTRLVAPELRYIVGDTTPFAVAFDPEHRDIVAEACEAAPLARRIVCGPSSEPGDLLLDALGVSAGEPVPARPPEPDDAMIAYSSGTTGFPKGAVITHANLVTQTYMAATAWRLGEDDRFLATTPLAHRTGLARLVNALVLGATAVVMPRFDAADAMRLIDAERITAMGVVPTVARMLLEHASDDPASGRSLRVVLVTGEAFPVDVKRRLLDRWPHVRLISFFAMTEASVVTLLPPEEQFTHPGSVGRPLPGVELRIVDDKDRDVPIGDVGEILVRSGEPGRWAVMRGYYNRPDATAEAFVDGFFRTGDLGRLDADGHLSIVDRRKDMILSGGLNVYSKEVERALESHPSVAEAAVIGVPDDRFGEAVVAYVIPRSGLAIAGETLTEHCKREIASFKKPKVVRIVDELPRNSLGKVLKAELRRRERRG